MALETRTEVTIHAGAKRVWQVLADTARYAGWNPLIRRVSTHRLVTGARPAMRVVIGEWLPMWIRPKLVRVDPPRELRWIGALFSRHLFHGEHVFLLEAVGASETRLIQAETYGGILAPLLAATLLRRADRGFDAMNAALKRVAEAPTPAGDPNT